jgi:chorismate synthase
LTEIFHFKTANRKKEDIFKMDIKERNDFLAAIRQAVVNTVMSLWVLQDLGEHLSSRSPTSFS